MTNGQDRRTHVLCLFFFKCQFGRKKIQEVCVGRGGGALDRLSSDKTIINCVEKTTLEDGWGGGTTIEGSCT